jgi:hypothetical protein
MEDTHVSHVPCALTATQRVLLAPLMRGSPVPQERLISHLYGARWDGGPDCADVCIRMHIARIRRRLLPHGIDLLTIGMTKGSRGYMVDPDHVDKLATLLAAVPVIELDQARENLRTSAARWRRMAATGPAGNRSAPAVSQLALAL